MAGVEYHAIRCAHCGLYQVQQVKKTSQFKCTMCRKQQKLHEEHFRGAAKHCREIVQRLNKVHHEGEIGFNPAATKSPEKPVSIPPEKRRKSAQELRKNDPKKRRKNLKSDETEVLAKKLQQQDVSDGDLFSFDTAKMTREAHSSTSAQVRSVDIDDDDDDYIFDDIPSPPKPRAIVSTHNCPSSKSALEASENAEGQVIGQSSARETSAENVGVFGKSTVQEAWRRRSLNKLAKFKFDSDENSTDGASGKASSASIIAASPKAEFCDNRIQGAASLEYQTSSDASKNLERSWANSSSSPASGKDRLLKTLNKLKMTPSSKPNSDITARMN